MDVTELKQAIERHSGKFILSQRMNPAVIREVTFAHLISQPSKNIEIPNVGMLREFYSEIGSLRLYFDESSQDSAIYIAEVNEWDLLNQDFSLWVSDLGESEREELLPTWINNCVVIGEVPSSGNYFLVPLEGASAGHIYEFEHDGFEFIFSALNIFDFIKNILLPTESMLVDFASHMTFMENEDWSTQWWIEEMQDSLGNGLKTRICA